MEQIPEEEMADVARAAHAVCQEAIVAGVYLPDLLRTPCGTEGSVDDSRLWL